MNRVIRQHEARQEHRQREAGAGVAATQERLEVARPTVIIHTLVRKNAAWCEPEQPPRVAAVFGLIVCRPAS